MSHKNKHFFRKLEENSEKNSTLENSKGSFPKGVTPEELWEKHLSLAKVSHKNKLHCRLKGSTAQTQTFHLVQQQAFYLVSPSSFIFYLLAEVPHPRAKLISQMCNAPLACSIFLGAGAVQRNDGLAAQGCRQKRETMQNNKASQRKFVSTRCQHFVALLG